MKFPYKTVDFNLLNEYSISGQKPRLEQDKSTAQKESKLTLSIRTITRSQVVLCNSGPK